MVAAGRAGGVTLFHQCQTNVGAFANLPLARVSICDYQRDVKANELRRRLEKLGCLVEDGTKHWIVYYRGHRTTVPRHPGKEIKTGTSSGSWGSKESEHVYGIRRVV
jgi:mRNA interferase HicA